MKKFGLFILIIILAATGILFFDKPLVAQAKHLIVFSSCDTPQEYKIGAIDPRFNISQSEFATDIKQAVAIWKTADGRTHFIYNPNGKLTISMQYDNRQSLDNQINNQQAELNQENGQLKPQLQQYNADAATFKQELADLNTQIAYWNTRGGAPPDVYNQLVQKQQSLQAEADKLNAEASELNQATNQYNVGVGQLHQTVSSFNTALSQKPEEGLYNSGNDTITIYFNNGYTELVHTLAHELGHAIGLGHNTGTDSIMYPQTNDSITPSTQDLSALTYACREQTILTVLQNKINIIIANYKASQKS